MGLEAVLDPLIPSVSATKEDCPCCGGHNTVIKICERCGERYYPRSNTLSGWDSSAGDVVSRLTEPYWPMEDE
jgi:hypothetical protein